MELSVDYFVNLKMKCHFLKLKCNEFSFWKKKKVST